MLEYRNIHIAEVPRRSRFPWPVEMVGWSETGDVGGKPHFTTHYEVCIRYYSEETFSEDIVPGYEIPFHVSFPQVFLKPPRSMIFNNIRKLRRTVCFTYRPETMAELEKILPIPKSPIWPVRLSESDLRDIGELRELMNHPYEYGVADRMDALCFMIFQSLTVHSDRVGETHDICEERIRRIADLLLLDCSLNHDFQELAARHGMSFRSFLRHWNRLFDLPPGRYLLELRLKSAARMLCEHPHLNVAEIAYQVGFSTPSHFGALFRRRFGVSPQRYRNEYLGVPNLHSRH